MQTDAAQIWQLVNAPRQMGVDYEDLLTILAGSNCVAIGMARASEPDHAPTAAKHAASACLTHPNVTGMLVLIAGSKQCLKLSVAMNVMRTVVNMAPPDIVVYPSVGHDETLGSTVRITIVAAVAA